MAQCQDIAPSITPPADTSIKEKIMAALGMQEIETTLTVDGESKTVVVLGRVVEEDEP